MTVDRSVPPKDVAGAIGVSVDTVGRYAREGLIPFTATPKGHRRYNVDQVRAAIADLQGPRLDRLRAAGAAQQSRLVSGPPLRPSAGSRLSEQLRATRTAPTRGIDAGTRVVGSALDDVLEHARRVLVATAR